MSTVTEVNQNLKALTEAGVSVWLDQLGRSLIAGGELKRLIAQESLRGITSNPAIFEKSILGTSDYDETIAQLARQNKSTLEIYDALVIADVQGAADTLKPVYDESGGTDGFVSLEVPPNLALNTEETLAAARRYWQAVDRPNLMIKIPGTQQGLPAIEQAIYEGINVNVTLLFATEAYAEVMEAYLKGLERRHAESKPLKVSSVASFFVSRVDTAVDKQLSDEQLKGKAALANAREAYQLFKARFAGPRWDALAQAGAVVQRPLWASTGVKNPNYKDTLYVDELIAPHTVNTMPLGTLNAVADHGKVPGSTADQNPKEVLAQLKSAGIDLKAVTDQLLEDGIKSFEDAFDKLLAGIDSQRQAVITGRPPTISASLPAAFEAAVSNRVKSAVSERVAQRVWKLDQSLWGGPGVPEIENRLGWLTVTEQMSEHLSDLTQLAGELKQEGYSDVLLLGMGGSSLGPEVIRRSLGDQGGLKLHVLDSTHPDTIKATEDSLNLAKTIFIVSS
ncbi:MAG: transaldolase, partial [Solirubrobacterales bacterium]|nr:transaldolase [Solirubrobacterales bacterium]